jgi:trimethylamine--corrinoid protein Co-methyltransferase
MARHYRLPCYSTAGVADAAEPGIQATVEKMITYADVPSAGAQYIHYAFGLLERTNVFCPEQAVMDDSHIGIVKWMLQKPDIASSHVDRVRSMIREVMASDHRTFIYHLPLPSREPVYVHYPLENDEGGALYAAHLKYQQLMEHPRRKLDQEIRREIEDKIPGILPAARL